MRRSRKPLSVARRIEGSNPSPSVSLSRIPRDRSGFGVPLHQRGSGAISVQIRWSPLEWGDRWRACGARARAVAAAFGRRDGAGVRFVVMLEERLQGAAVGSTEDVFDASGPLEAERLAIGAWRVAKPDGTFVPLLTVTLHDPEETGDG